MDISFPIVVRDLLTVFMVPLSACDTLHHLGPPLWHPTVPVHLHSLNVLGCLAHSLAGQLLSLGTLSHGSSSHPSCSAASQDHLRSRALWQMRDWKVHSRCHLVACPHPQQGVKQCLRMLKEARYMYMYLHYCWLGKGRTEAVHCPRHTLTAAGGRKAHPVCLLHVDDLHQRLCGVKFTFVLLTVQLWTRGQQRWISSSEVSERHWWWHNWVALKSRDCPCHILQHQLLDPVRWWGHSLLITGDLHQLFSS